jgi:5-formyltetrahydrofolate cyclo-ligase
MTKAEWRKHYRKVREQISSDAAALWSKEMGVALARRLRAISFDGVLFLFAAVKGEPDLLPYLENGSFNIALPKTCANGQMDFFIWFPTDELVIGSYDIREPNNDAIKVYPRAGDCAVIPAMAVDSLGHRLGGGKGCYDRWLREYKSRLLFTAAAIFPPCIATELLPQEEHDIPVDFWTFEF